MTSPRVPGRADHQHHRLQRRPHRRREQRHCGFHAVITYSGTLKKKVTATARTMLIAPALLGSDGLGYAVTWLGKSPFDPGTFNVLPTNLTADAYY